MQKSIPFKVVHSEKRKLIEVEVILMMNGFKREDIRSMTPSEIATAIEIINEVYKSAADR